MDKKWIDGCKEHGTQDLHYSKPENWLSTYGPELCDQGVWVQGAYNTLPRRKPRSNGWIIE